MYAVGLSSSALKTQTAGTQEQSLSAVLPLPVYPYDEPQLEELLRLSFGVERRVLLGVGTNGQTGAMLAFKGSVEFSWSKNEFMSSA